MSVFLIIARSIEFGDLKTQKWLTSLVTGFFSSILFSQPIKVVCLTIFFACFARRSLKDDDREAEGYIDEDESIYLNGGNEDDFQPTTNKIDRLSESQTQCARIVRLRELRMWKLVRDVLYQLFFIWIVFMINYLNRNDDNFLQVNHLRGYFLAGDRGMKSFLEVRRRRRRVSRRSRVLC